MSISLVLLIPDEEPLILLEEIGFHFFDEGLEVLGIDIFPSQEPFEMGLILYNLIEWIVLSEAALDGHLECVVCR